EVEDRDDREFVDPGQYAPAQVYVFGKVGGHFFQDRIVVGPVVELQVDLAVQEVLVRKGQGHFRVFYGRGVAEINRGSNVPVFKGLLPDNGRSEEFLPEGNPVDRRGQGFFFPLVRPGRELVHIAIGKPVFYS